VVNATKVNAGPAESNGRLWRDSLHVTCGLTASTPGSAPGPTLGNEYGKTLTFYFTFMGKSLLSCFLTHGVYMSLRRGITRNFYLKLFNVSECDVNENIHICLFRANI